MPLTLSGREIALRLLFTLIGGALLGFNRGEQGRPAGLRTTLLVCFAASLSMIETNLLLVTSGKTPESFAVLDLMRLPLGILSGMGFIGAGAIMRKDDRVMGITTAATLWFTTMVGICFGGGQTGLGFASVGMGIFILEVLKYIEKGMKQERHASLTFTLPPGLVDAESTLRSQLLGAQFRIVSCSMSFDTLLQRHEIRYEVSWHAKTHQTEIPSLIHRFFKDSEFTQVHWNPAQPSHGLN